MIARATLALAPLVLATLIAASPPPAAPSHAASPSAHASGSPSSLVPPGPNRGAAFNIGVWTVKTSTVDSNFKTGEFSAPSAVTMTREGGDVRADRATGNFNTSQATLFGHVVMHDQQGNFSALRGQAPSGPSRGPSTLTADQAHLDGKAKVYAASGNVHYTQADTTVDADKAILHDDTHDLFLEGGVHITQGARSLNADRVHYNTDTGDSHADGNVTLQFPSSFNPTLATPRPINIKNPLSHKTAAPEPASTPTP
ncbi:MAG: LPS export ABC transporter periplasmic protein LptC [Vulcanimicrobiaceae bacterium]